MLEGYFYSGGDLLYLPAGFVFLADASLLTLLIQRWSFVLQKTKHFGVVTGLKTSVSCWPNSALILFFCVYTVSILYFPAKQCKIQTVLHPPPVRKLPCIHLQCPRLLAPSCQKREAQVTWDISLERYSILSYLTLQVLRRSSHKPTSLMSSSAACRAGA